MMDDKYTFTEFLGAYESEDFDNHEKSWEEWGEKFTESMPEILKTEYHRGDCTNEPTACSICQFETMLREYREYCKNPDKWKKENGI